MITYVTSFLDLNRGEWGELWKRTTSEYFDCFSHLLELFKNNEEYELFVYMDIRYYQTTRNMCDNYNNVFVVPITEKILYEISPLWRRLEEETRIMFSEDYKNIIRHRINHPEHFDPKYTMINHIKIDLVIHTMNMTNSSILGWTDFGYFKTPESIPYNLLDSNRIYPGAITIAQLFAILPEHYDIGKYIVDPPEIFEGGSFFGNRESLLKYQKEYHDMHSYFHSIGIVDDDQHIMLQIYRKNPDLFNVYFQYGKWLKMQKCIEKPTRKVVVELAGGLGNQLFELANAFALGKNLGFQTFVLLKNTHDMRQGNRPELYMNTIYKNLRFIQTIPEITEKTLVIREEKWAWYNLHDKVEEYIKSNPNIDTIYIQYGFFSSEKYFEKYRKDIKQLFLPKEGVKEWLLKNSPSLAEIYPDLFSRKITYSCLIGVRRTDYLQYPEHNPCSLEYFQQAMTMLERDTKIDHYYITSDDLDWCKTQFIGPKYKFIDSNLIKEKLQFSPDLLDFYIGMLFPVYIISNSTFHWWFSYFSVYDNPIVIAPDKWHGGPNCIKENYWSIYRNNMTVLERKV